MDTKYFEVFLTRELQARYYVKAEDEMTAHELAWKEFDDEIYREEWNLQPNSSDWEYETIVEEINPSNLDDYTDEWLVAEEEDFLAAVNYGGEV
jgi:hypothetical protein